MLVTVTNTTDVNASQVSRSINVPAVGEDGISVGGGVRPAEATHLVDPLPYPFAHTGEMAAGGSLQLPMHPIDWRVNAGLANSQMHRGTPVRDQWNMLVQAGVVSFATAAQADGVDSEELFVAAV